jgi:hypothetical protein
MERSLTDAQVELYSRQILLQEVGGIGQKKLLGSAVLLVGEGAAVEVTASYLAGAGVGRLDLLCATNETASSELRDAERSRAIAALAPLAERNPDVRIGERTAPPARLDEYDVVLVEAASTARLAAASSSPRIGAIRLEGCVDVGIGLVLLPATAQGCVVCARLDRGSRREASHERDGWAEESVGDAELAGALAALAVCRWIGTPAVDGVVVGLHLAPGAPTWEPAEVAFAAACARGCRP